MAIVRPPKRRRMGHKLSPMVDGSDASSDTVMYIRSEGERIIVPVRLDSPPQPDPEPNAHQECMQDAQQPPDMDSTYSEQHDRPPRRDRSLYMRQFVARAEGILQAMQAREAIPDSEICANCRKSACWRCDDCVGGLLLCRFCMRHSHALHPFHRIECWTGTHFRKASLWEVGVYLILPHQASIGICDNLSWQQEMLEKLQVQKDSVIQQHTHSQSSEPEHLSEADPVQDQEKEAIYDNAAIQFLDHVLDGRNPDEILEEDDDTEPVDTEADLEDTDAGTAGFTNYMHDQAGSDSAMPTAPSCDALSNQYIRVVHTNGIHHIALVSCTCRGHDITTDLIYAGWVPTSFIRVRTIFTAAVLDHFRYCNLEMRSSAYQFFQMLRRITNSLSPTKVVNLYHELRRLSRLWRWTKKLRWAGFAQQVGQPLTPKPGELGNFCPACPQVGVNIPDTWKDDPNRWVFRRVLTADGNFKADHVRQKSPADDIWLSDGLGMTTRNSDYKEFLKTAVERQTVSC